MEIIFVVAGAQINCYTPCSAVLSTLSVVNVKMAVHVPPVCIHIVRTLPLCEQLERKNCRVTFHVLNISVIRQIA